jgi:AMP phosphorylase
MKFKVKRGAFSAGRPIAILNSDKAKSLNLHLGDRIRISRNKNQIIAMLDTTKDFLEEDEISLSKEIIDSLKTKAHNIVDISPVESAKSIRFILKKLNGQALSKSEIYSIIEDIVNNALSEAEIAYFVSGVYEHGMTFQETLFLTEAMYKTGTHLKWSQKYIVDKHCIGGIPGNRTTPIVVSICAAAGLIMPKTSSRAITSAAGTADVIETVCNVDFSAEQLKKIVKKTNACLAWNGSFAFAPSDDILIRIEKLLNVDPEAQLLASILSKKLALGSKYVLIDIPYGEGAKVSKEEGEKLKAKFIRIGKHFGLHMNVILTKGDQPIGNGIGPILEMKDIYRVLKQDNSPKDLEEKSIILSSQILEMTGKAKKGQGVNLAKTILHSGKAYEKFQEIISAQGRRNHFKLAKFTHNIQAKSSGKITHIDNKKVNYISRVLGCPIDKGSGIYLHKHKFDPVTKGETIITLYSESQNKLKEAILYINNLKPIIY